MHKRRGPVLEQMARADATGLALLRDAADSMHLSARGYHRVLRVARTLADLDGAKKSAACISPERCPTARSPTKCAGRRRCRRVTAYLTTSNALL